MRLRQRIEEEDLAFGRRSESYGLRSSVLLRLFYDSLVLPWSLLNGPLTFRVAGQVGRMLNRLKLSGPAPSSVRTVFGCGTAEAGVIAGEMTANYFRNRAVIAFIRNQGLQRLSTLVEIEQNPTARELASQERPAILLAWHVGALFGIPGAAFQTGRSVLVFRKKPFYKPTPKFRVVTTQLRTDEEKSLLLCESLKHLKAGGMVILAADGDTGGIIKAPCLGRSVDFRRGAFALSRLAGTPLIPHGLPMDAAGTHGSDVSSAIAGVPRAGRRA